MANVTCETLRDGETTVFLCKTETFWGLWIARSRLRPHIGLQKIRHCKTFRTTQITRLRDPWNMTKILRDLYFLQGPFTTPNKCNLFLLAILVNTSSITVLTVQFLMNLVHFGWQRWFRIKKMMSENVHH